VPPQALRSRSRRALAVRGLAESRDRRRLLEGHLHRPVLGDDRVGARLGVDDLSVAKAGRAEIEGGTLPAEMHADGRVSEVLGDHRGEQVLAGVLLHVVEAARPVDRSGEPVTHDRGLDDVGDAVALVDHVDDRHAAEPTGVERLAPGGGVEGGAVEIDPAAGVGTGCDGGVEGGEIGVGVVEAGGHGVEV